VRGDGIFVGGGWVGGWGWPMAVRRGAERVGDGDRRGEHGEMCRHKK